MEEISELSLLVPLVLRIHEPQLPSVYQSHTLIVLVLDILCFLIRALDRSPASCWDDRPSWLFAEFRVGGFPIPLQHSK